ncbi:MAG: outer membrane beta-barrel protein [Bacteroidales bacterium]|jgi:outer membrane protein
MKLKTIFISLLLLASTLAYSQTEKGKWHLSGSSSIQVANSSISVAGRTHSATTIIFNPSVGYFVAKNFSLAMDMGVMSQDGETNFSVIPTASYFFPTRSNLRPVAQVGVGYSQLSGYGRSSGVVVGAGIGVAYFASENISVDIGMQYLYNNYDGDALNTIAGMVGFSVYF